MKASKHARFGTAAIVACFAVLALGHSRPAFAVDYALSGLFANGLYLSRADGLSTSPIYYSQMFYAPSTGTFHQVAGSNLSNAQISADVRIRQLLEVNVGEKNLGLSLSCSTPAYKSGSLTVYNDCVVTNLKR